MSFICPFELQGIVWGLYCKECIEIVKDAKPHCVTCLLRRTANMGQHKNVIIAAKCWISTRFVLETMYYNRVNYSCELYLDNRTQELREDWIQDYIDNPTTKKIVCNPALLNAKTINLAKIAHRYVMSAYGVSIKDYY